MSPRAFHKKLPVNSSYIKNCSPVWFELDLAASLSWRVEQLCVSYNTYISSIQAQSVNTYHQVLIGAIISTLNDLSIQIYKRFLFLREICEKARVMVMKAIPVCRAL